MYLYYKNNIYNKEVFIDYICPNYSCEKEIGIFNLGDKKHKASIKLKDKCYETFVGYINIEDIRIIKTELSLSFYYYF